MIEKSDC